MFNRLTLVYSHFLCVNPILLSRLYTQVILTWMSAAKRICWSWKQVTCGSSSKILFKNLSTSLSEARFNIANLLPPCPSIKLNDWINWKVNSRFLRIFQNQYFAIFMKYMLTWVNIVSIFCSPIAYKVSPDWELSWYHSISISQWHLTHSCTQQKCKNWFFPCCKPLSALNSHGVLEILSL